MTDPHPVPTARCIRCNRGVYGEPSAEPGWFYCSVGCPCQASAADETTLSEGDGTPGPFARPRHGRYEVLSEIGRGGVGIVYEARPIGGGPSVALKTLREGTFASPQSRRRFEREIRVAASRDPGVVGHIEHGIGADGVPWYVMERVRGCSLAQVLSERGAVPWAESARIAAAVGRTLARLQDRGVAHRDIKPANILVREDGAVLLADFGLALVGGDGDDGADRSPRAVGTPAYMAPEIRAGDLPPGGWFIADQWSLGAVLFELLVGRRACDAGPLDGSDDRAPGWLFPSGVPTGLVRCCQRALHPLPALRFVDWAEFASALAPFAGPVSTQHGP